MQRNQRLRAMAFLLDRIREEREPDAEDFLATTLSGDADWKWLLAAAREAHCVACNARRCCCDRQVSAMSAVEAAGLVEYLGDDDAVPEPDDPSKATHEEWNYAAQLRASITAGETNIEQACELIASIPALRGRRFMDQMCLWVHQAVTGELPRQRSHRAWSLSDRQSQATAAAAFALSAASLRQGENRPEAALYLARAKVGEAIAASFVSGAGPESTELIVSNSDHWRWPTWPALTEACQAHANRFKFSAPARRLAELECAMRLHSLSKRSPNTYVSLLSELGTTCRSLGRFEDARSYYLKASSSVANCSRSRQRIFQTELGILEMDAGNLEASFAHFGSAKELAATAEEQAIVDFETAQAYHWKGEFEKALSLAQSAIDTLCLDGTTLSAASNTVAFYQMTAGNVAAGFSTLRRHAAQTDHNVRAQWAVVNGIGHLIQGSWTEAASHLEEGIDLYGALERIQDAAVSSLYLSEAHLRQGDHQAAMKALALPLQYFAMPGRASSNMALTLKQLSEAIQGQGAAAALAVRLREVAWNAGGGVPVNRSN